ncbi:MraY family glycosyltransferase [Larkinella soli]|uniref:MraY family glycosyltransferase n=1 Tax=Larkinella soli TaxID=1770527 RepID=UPI0013E3428D|nr:glycosyltransferase family 4 protein [Larkinella soli]
MNWFVYSLAGVLLFTTELLYISLAVQFRIIDRPNERSSHTRPTVRGGGIVFWVAALAAFFVDGLPHPCFFAGLTLIASISFLDDLFSLPGRYRFLVQLVSVGLLWLDLPDPLLYVGWVPAGLLVGCGVVNACNFMDGINGMTAFYGLVNVLTLLWLNGVMDFTDPALLGFSAAGLLVFAFFNARRKAVCFAGDVGSVSLAFILLFLLVQLVMKSGNPIYLLFLAVYGADSGLTIVHRLLNRENIFRPHKLHLFQLLVHRLHWPHLRVAGLYALVQAVINALILWLEPQGRTIQILAGVAIPAGLIVIYEWSRSRLIKQKPQREAVAVG